MDKTASTKGLVIVRLLGGLGNQMFQYAFGRSMSILHKRELKFDLGFYRNQNAKWALRTYDLDNFNIQISSATDKELRPFKKYLQQNPISKLLRRVSSVIPVRLKSYIFEPYGQNFSFDKRLLEAKFRLKVYLDGFWQTEKYFLGIEEIIRKDFTFKELPSETNRKMLEEIASVNSVAIHIRHGDNATKIAAHHGVLPLEYYQTAAQELVKTVGEPHFYIFSDDPAWAKDNLKLNYPASFVNHNGEEKHHEDLRLMAACKHQIIGNSTFSWWGAWLGKKAGQIVYAPSRYHINTPIAMNDYYPSDWNLVSV